MIEENEKGESTLQILIVTGAKSKMVVTLSRKAEIMAVNKHMTIVMYQRFPFDNLYTLTAPHSKTPVVEKIPTMIIIPNNRPTVS